MRISPSNKQNGVWSCLTLDERLLLNKIRTREYLMKDFKKSRDRFNRGMVGKDYYLMKAAAYLECDREVKGLLSKIGSS